eukprot:TRINITY_DN9960_c0_g1_i3.p1 TRINITY_DN9960_c0_g1~~TRINITY_DN9960_c0_g1_i3.p1  ORF type:complete len:524 (-),score=127.06 TRINITY_DN9960_c0_g1_i3:45-1616(-)
MEQKAHIVEISVNEEATKLHQSQPAVQRFQQWLVENNVRISPKIRYPVCFGQEGYTGVLAVEAIEPNEAIIAIPNHVLITVSRAQTSELAEIIIKNPDAFEEHYDKEFNTLVLFIIFEKMKEEKSFWHIYFDIVGQIYTLSDWSDAEIEELDSPAILKDLEEIRKENHDLWLRMKMIMDENPNLFPPEKVSYEIFRWASAFVMTRSFGWGLPGSLISPLADLLNHNNDGCTNFLISIKGEQSYIPDYRRKKDKLDLTILPEFNKRTKENELSYDVVTRYLIKNKEKLRKPMSDEEIRALFKEEKQQLVKEINAKLIDTPGKQVWTLNYFLSSDSEDNDTEEEEEEGEEEEEEKKEDNLKETNRNGKLEQKDESTVIDQQKIFQVDDDDYKDEIVKQEFSSSFGKGVTTVSLSTIQSPKEYFDTMGPIERQQLREISTTAKNTNKNTTDEEEDDEKFPWYNTLDDQIYFLVATHADQKVEKNQQLFYFYGSRTNKYLLSWYGFCYSNNRYDSCLLYTSPSPRDS